MRAYARLWLLGATFLLILLFCFSPIVKDVRKLNVPNDGKPSVMDITLPHYVHSPSGQHGPLNYTYSLTIDYAGYQSTVFNFMGDDCVRHISINSQRLPTWHLPCHPLRPIMLDLSDYLKPGPNYVQLIVTDHEFSNGLDVKPATWGGPPSILSALLVGILTCLAGAFVSRLRGGREAFATQCLFAFGALLAFYFTWNTGYMEFGNDLLGHRDYMLFIAEKKRLPLPWEGWIFYHPPLYYIIGAVCIWIEQATQRVDAFTLLRLFNAVCYLTFLYYGILFLRRFLEGRAAYLLMVALYVTFPGMILTSLRVDSHTLLYALWAAALYNLAAWVQGKKTAHLLRTMVAVAIGILTRSNILVMLGTLGCVVLMEIILGKVKLRELLKTRMIVGGLLIVLALGANFGDTIYGRYKKLNTMPLVVSNVETLAGYFRLQPDAANYVSINIKHHIGLPFYNTFSSPDREYLWPSELKSSMFGEFTFIPTRLASIMNMVLLFFWACMIGGILTMQREMFLRQRFYLLSLALFIVAVVLNRYFHPFSTTQDFRYVMPMMILVFYGLGLAFARFKARVKTGASLHAVYTVMIAFVIISSAFFPLHMWMDKQAAEQQKPSAQTAMPGLLPPYLTDEGTMRVPNSR